MMLCSVAAPMLLRFAENAIPTWERRRSTEGEADDAGQPRYCLVSEHLRRECQKNHRKDIFTKLYITRDADGEIVDAVEGFANITVRSRC